MSTLTSNFGGKQTCSFSPYLYADRWGPDALLPFGLTEESTPDSSVDVGGVDVRLVRPSERDAAFDDIKAHTAGRQLVVIDYTHPDAALENVEQFGKWQLPFVMGTTGYDSSLATASINNSGIYAVLAPNMGKPIVLFQAMLEHLAKTYPGSLGSVLRSLVQFNFA